MSDVVRRQSGPFRAGDRVQLTGPKGRLNTVTLAAGGAFHSAPWFRASVGLYLLLGFSHARARRAQRNGLVPGADPETTLAALRKIERWGWAMCAAASGIALLMVVRPSP